MHWACQEANPEIVKLLVEFKADIELPNGKGGSPLMLSLNESRSEDKLEILRTLIKARVDINRIDSRGMSPLNKACHDESPGAVQLLLEAEGGTRSINRACMQGTHPVSHSRGQRGVTCGSHLLPSLGTDALGVPAGPASHLQAAVRGKGRCRAEERQGRVAADADAHGQLCAAR